MRLFIVVGIVLVCAGVISKKQSVKPLYFDLPIEIEDTFDKSKIGELMEDDLLEPISVELVTGPKGPLYYQSNIRTTVCDDEVCEIMYIKLYWDLVGQYVGYDTVAQHPLTKFDHEPFTVKDYDRLHELLNNDGSILKFKQKSELIDKEKVKASDVVDGTTGATALEIKEEVVEGALYSSYTLWHLVYNGQIKNMINENTEKLYGSFLKYKFSNSERNGYKLFAIKHLTEEDFFNDVSTWTSFLKNSIPLARKSILENVPNVLWDNESIQLKVANMFSDFDVNSRTVFLNKLKNIPIIYGSVLEELSNYIQFMNRNQTQEFLSLVSLSNFKSDKITDNLVNARSDSKYQYGYIIEEYLRFHYVHK